MLRSARYPVPSYTYPETAVRALAHALRYAAWRSRPSGTLPILADVDVNQARRRLPHQEVDGAEAGLAPGWVTGTAAMDVLAAFGVPVVRTVEAHSTEEAGKWADEIGGPVALKVLGPVHKTEGGGVRLGLVGHDAVVAAYGSMVATFGEEMTGALLQPMVAGGVETIVGGDPGPIVRAARRFRPGRHCRRGFGRPHNSARSPYGCRRSGNGDRVAGLGSPCRLSRSAGGRCGQPGAGVAPGEPPSRGNARSSRARLQPCDRHS